ncbi:hypothetical protein N9Y92_02125 [Chlamydiales bacterium]|nr:hypothetical protein [Chlamydiales bacterium]
MDEKEISVGMDDPSFYLEAFTSVSDESDLITKSFEPMSSQIDKGGIQDSSAYRTLQRSYAIAKYLIDEEGVMDVDLLPPLIKRMKENLYSIGPGREMDCIKAEHQLAVLEKLYLDKGLRRLLFSIDKPEDQKHAHTLIRRTMGLNLKASVTKGDARRAVLSGWLTLLRQNVGSCFATAPALLIQQEHPEYLLKDLRDLFNRGMLKRIFSGKEHIAPLSASPGIGDLRKQVLITEAIYEVLENSPGIRQAFLAMGIDEPLAPLIKKALEKKVKMHLQLVLSIEEIMSLTLMHWLNLTEKDLLDFKNRPKPMIYSSLMIMTERKRESRSPGEVAAAYLELFEEGKAVFCTITDHPVLKAWEFTLASFAETQAQFATWNLYSSLGLDPQEVGGIGYIIQNVVQEMLENSNQKMLGIQDEYQIAWQLLQGVEARIRNAESERQLRWIRADYQSKKNEFYTLEEMRDKEQYLGKKLANMHHFLMDQLTELFPKYFQEVYDPDLHEVKTGPYDDAPAGFRLMYKHGRINPSQWTYVRNYQEFIETLNSFFIAFENEVRNHDYLEGIEGALSEIITQVSLQIKSQEFIETAFQRMARAHQMPIIKDPLNNLDKIEKKPWAYTSGGTMAALVSNYFGREEKPKDLSTWVESPMELLVFLLDAVKKLPYKDSEEFIKHKEHSLLIHSPTHAFRFMPGLSPFNRGWERKDFTYTFARDHLVTPIKYFFDQHRLDDEMITHLIQELKINLPKDFQDQYDSIFRNHPRHLSAKEFVSYFIQEIRQDKKLYLLENTVFSVDQIDALLYANIPYVRGYQLEEVIQNALKMIDGSLVKPLNQLFDKKLGPIPAVLPAKRVLDLLKACYALLNQEATFPFNPHKTLLETLQKLEHLAPSPILFADTNWEKDYFGFTISPSSDQLSLWRFTPFSVEGSPMSYWNKYLDGTTKHPPWGIYINLNEYQ